MAGPLEHVLTGLKVLDLTRALAGPSCTRMFAELGADVIKIESAPNGDLTRRLSKIRNERSLYYVQQNLGKKSVCIDLRDPRGMALVEALVPKVDVVVTDYNMPGLSGLEVAHTLTAQHPALPVVVSSGYVTAELQQAAAAGAVAALVNKVDTTEALAPTVREVLAARAATPART